MHLCNALIAKSLPERVRRQAQTLRPDPAFDASPGRVQRPTLDDPEAERSSMTYRCDHVHLRSRDPVAAAAFYVEMFGARETDRIGGDTVQRVILDLGGLAVFIEQAPEEAHAPLTTPCPRP
ncbi:VOC family protein [Methylobacterium komagatae]